MVPGSRSDRDPTLWPTLQRGAFSRSGWAAPFSPMYNSRQVSPRVLVSDLNPPTKLAADAALGTRTSRGRCHAGSCSSKALGADPYRSANRSAGVVAD
jgi:hypothetical protein